MVSKILVPLDGSPGSEAILQEAETIARAEKATIRLLHVAPPVEAIIEDDRLVAYVDQEAARVAQEVRSYLGKAAAGLFGVEVQHAVRFGDPAEEIASEALEAGADLIAMATHRRTGVRRLVEGSVAERVSRATEIPVLLVPYSPVPHAHRHTARRGFWCGSRHREVEVEFEVRGLPGFRAPADVVSCTAFEPPTAVGCRRQCLDPTFRRQWEPSLPVHTQTS